MHPLDPLRLSTEQPGKSRTWGWMLAVVALLAGLLLAWLGRTSTETVPVPKSGEHVPSQPIELLAAPRTHEPTAPTRVPHPARSLRVRVQDEASGSGVSGAEVSLLRTSARRAWLAEALRSDVVASGLTDREGARALDSSALDSGDGELVVRAVGYVPWRAPIPKGMVDITVGLREGAVVRGRVVTLDGVGVGGLRVSARQSGEMHAALLARLGVESIPRPSAVTGEEGAFEIRGLAPSREHQLDLDTSDWVVIRSTPTAVVAGPLGPIVEATLIVERLGYVRIRLVDAGSGQAVTQRPTGVFASDKTGRELPLLIVGEQAPGALTAGELEAIAASYVETHVLQLRSLPAGVDQVRATVAVPEYKQTSSIVRVQSFALVRDGDAADEIRLTREAHSETGALRVAGARDPSHGMREQARALAMLLPPGGLPEGKHPNVQIVTHRGSSPAPDEWLFTHLSVGEWQVRVWDGISWSAPEPVVIEAGRETLAGVRWAPPSGATLTLVTRGGTRVFGATVAYHARVRAPGESALQFNLRSGVATWSVTAPRSSGEAAPPPGWLELAPGSYDLTVHVSGFKPSKVQLEVVEGRATPVVVTLEPSSEE